MNNLEFNLRKLYRPLSLFITLILGVFIQNVDSYIGLPKSGSLRIINSQTNKLTVCQTNYNELIIIRSCPESQINSI